MLQTPREHAIYFAGLIDGEGHIGCNIYSGAKRPVIALNMTDPVVVKMFADYYRLAFRERNSPSALATYARGYKQQYTCRGECHKAHDIIKDLRPFLVTKAAAADEALSYYTGRSCVVCGTEIDEIKNKRTKYCSAACRQKYKRVTGSAQRVEVKYRQKKQGEAA